MFSGGQQVNRTLGDAQSLMCGEALDPIQTPDQTCLDVVEGLYNANTPQQNQDIYDQWVMLATARVYGDCGFKAAGDIPIATTCVRQAVGNGQSPAHITLFESISSPTAPIADKPVLFMGEFYSYAEFFKKANELAVTGVNVYDIPLDIPVPESVMTAIRDLTGNNPLLNTEIVRVYREAMRTRPPMEQVNPAIQEAVGMNVVEHFKQAKTKGTADTADDMSLGDFYRYTVKSYGDVAFDDYSVIIKQIPDTLITDLNIPNSEVPAMGEVRRLFVQVENTIKDNPRVAAHLATLDAAARDAYMAPIRAQITEKIKPAIEEKIEGLTPDKIKSELQKYDAVVDFDVADDKSVNIIKIELKEKALEGTGLIPQALIDGLDARSSIVRFAAVARIWASVVELAPDAADPGELQDGLVNSLIGQLHDATNEGMLRTIVISVDEQNRTVTLGEAPEGILSEETPAWGHAEIAGSSVTIFEHYIRENPGLSDAEQTELAGEIRDAIEAFEEEHAGEQTLAGTVTRDQSGNFHVEITRIGGGYTGDDPTQNGGFVVDGELGITGLAGTSESVVGGEAFALIELGYQWPSFKLFGGFGLLAYGAGEYLTNSEGASFQMTDGGESSAFRMDQAYLGGVYTYGDGKIKFKGGLMGMRYSTPHSDLELVDGSLQGNPAQNYYYNMLFGLRPIPDAGSSRLGGVSADWTHNFGIVALTLGALGGQSIRANLWQSDVSEGQSQFAALRTVIGGHMDLEFTLHEATATTAHVGAAGYYPGEALVTAGISSHFHENVILAADAYYAHLWTNGNPDEQDAYAVSLFGFFPFKGAGATWIPYAGVSYGETIGTAHWGGDVVNGGCTHIGVDCGDNLVDTGFGGFSGDAGLEIRPLSEDSPVQLSILAGGNFVWGSSRTSGASAGPGGSGRLQLKLNF